MTGDPHAAHFLTCRRWPDRPRLGLWVTPPHCSLLAKGRRPFPHPNPPVVSLHAAPFLTRLRPVSHL